MWKRSHENKIQFRFAFKYRQLKFINLTIIVRAVFEEDGKY